MRSRFLLYLLAVLIIGILTQGFMTSPGDAEEPESVRSSPADTTPYTREAVAEDYSPATAGPTATLAPSASSGPPNPCVFMVDTVINNTDPTLTNTDMFNDGETSIAVNPQNANEIVISAFSFSFPPGGWPPTGENSPIFHSLDGGLTWTKQFTVPAPPGQPGAIGCPCDQTFDYGRGDQLSATFLADNIYSGSTTNPANAAFWNWFAPGGVTQATNLNNVPPPGGVDQPWLLVNSDPFTPIQDNVYVAYDDFTNGLNCAGNACTMRVSVSFGANPPNFTVDNPSGIATGGVNPGHRLTKDPWSGFIYSLFQRNIAAGAGGSKNIDYMLNRSTDGGMTWGLNGNANGIIVANADSTQPTPKFGTVNALLGGVDHAGVDPNTGDLYYAYGNRDAVTGNDRLAIRRITDAGGGNVNVGPQNFVTGQVQAAIPQVAVTDSGTVGVFYYTFDGFNANLPIFTAHLATSRNQGVTFTDRSLLTFLSSAPDNNNARQRVLGDYMQMKTLHSCFYGSFTANGVPFGRPFANHDPIFFKHCELDHFLGYRVFPRTVGISFPNAVLTDQFVPEGETVQITKPDRLYNPADKNGEGIFYKDVHLVGYRLSTFVDQPFRTVEVTNQFGRQQLVTGSVTRLLVPSTKAIGKTPPRALDRHGSPLPDDFVDHFKCYAVKSAFSPVEVTVADQLFDGEPRTFVVKRPISLCNPVEKQLEGEEPPGPPRDRVNHLVCYEVEPRQRLSIPVETNNQVRPETMDVTREWELCVPSMNAEVL